MRRRSSSERRERRSGERSRGGCWCCERGFGGFGSVVADGGGTSERRRRFRGGRDGLSGCVDESREEEAAVSMCCASSASASGRARLAPVMVEALPRISRRSFPQRCCSCSSSKRAAGVEAVSSLSFPAVFCLWYCESQLRVAWRRESGFVGLEPLVDTDESPTSNSWHIYYPNWEKSLHPV
jgi:hypothetical protein